MKRILIYNFYKLYYANYEILRIKIYFEIREKNKIDKQKETKKKYKMLDNYKMQRSRLIKTIR